MVRGISAQRRWAPAGALGADMARGTDSTPPRAHRRGSQGYGARSASQRAAEGHGHTERSLEWEPRTRNQVGQFGGARHMMRLRQERTGWAPKVPWPVGLPSARPKAATPRSEGVNGGAPHSDSAGAAWRRAVQDSTPPRAHRLGSQHTLPGAPLIDAANGRLSPERSRSRQKRAPSPGAGCRLGARYRIRTGATGFRKT